MKNVIRLLQSGIRARKEMIDLYEHNPHNQAVNEYTANEARKDIVEFEKAITALESSNNEGEMPAIAHLRKVLQEFFRPAHKLDGIPVSLMKAVDEADVWLSQQPSCPSQPEKEEQILEEMWKAADDALLEIEDCDECVGDCFCHKHHKLFWDAIKSLHNKF